MRGGAIISEETQLRHALTSEMVKLIYRAAPGTCLQVFNECLTTNATNAYSRAVENGGLEAHPEAQETGTDHHVFSSYLSD